MEYVAVYQGTVGDGTNNMRRLEGYELFRYGFKFERGTPDYAAVFSGAEESIMANYYRLVNAGTLRRLPVFTPQSMYESMTRRQQSDLVLGYATMVAMAEYGQAEFPVGCRVRVRFNERRGCTGKAVLNPGSSTKTVCMGIMEGAPQVAISVHLDGDKYPITLAMADVTLEADDDGY